MSRQKFPLAVAVAVLSSTFLGSCSLLRGDNPEPTVNVKQAIKRVDSVLDETLKAVHPRLKWRDDPAHLSERRNSFTNTADGEVRVGRERHVRTKISKAKLNELLTIVDKHWRKEGFKTKLLNPREPSISGTASDGCIVNFSVSGFGDVSIAASVGAVSDAPSGDIEGEEGDDFPKSPEGGPDYTPDVRDPYWST
ncbi:hypothetical protein ACH4SK_19555 [Streptomyces inhibens]|uniref:hypothetical protein n=1 Tax=Streptomyces inhibens TaxID=2293571 RepID=UPI0037AED421